MRNRKLQFSDKETTSIIIRRVCIIQSDATQYLCKIFLFEREFNFRIILHLPTYLMLMLRCS